MTAHGEEMMRMGASYMRLRIGQLLKHFTAEEQGQLLMLMTKLIDSIEAER